MNSVLNKIFDTNQIVDSTGRTYPLHSHTEKSHGLGLQDIIREIKPVYSIEIGLAYGISSLFILETLSQINGKKHIIIDPEQDTGWKDIGLFNIKKAGYEHLIEFHKAYSFDILPKLYFEGQKIQFAYIDTTKVFDIVLVDTFYISKMLDVGGVFVLDDVSFPGIRKIARFYSKHPSYKIVFQYKQDVLSRKKLFYKKIINFIISKIPYKDKIFIDIDFSDDTRKGIDYHSVGFKKIKEDKRNWDWFEKF